MSTPQLLTSLVEEAVTVGSLVRLLQFGGGTSQLVEVTLAAGSPAAGITIADLEMPREAAIVAVVRERRVLAPHSETVLADGDEVLLITSGDSEETVRRFLVGP